MDAGEPLCSVQGLYDYTSTDPASLSFSQGDVIHVLAKLESGWWDGWCNGRRGWFPSNYVEEIKEVDYSTFNAPNSDLAIHQQQQQQQNTSPLISSQGIRPQQQLRLSLNATDMDHLSYYEEPLEHSHQSYHYQQQQQQQPQQNGGTKSDWILQTTEDGSEVYYFNVVTKEMRNSLPPDSDMASSLNQLSNSNNNNSNNNNTNTDPSSSSPLLKRDIINHQTDILKEDIIHPTAINIDENRIIQQQQINTNSPILHHRTASVDDISTPDDVKLPPNWVRKANTKGRIYYCNVLTDETTWNMEDIDFQTGYLTTSSSQKNREMQSSTITTTTTTANNTENQPLSWNQLSSLIAQSIHELKNSIRQGQTNQLREDAVMVVHRIRLMLYVSNTVDKESSPHLKNNKSLRLYHRALLASLAKTVLSTKAASGSFSYDDALHKLQIDADQLLVDVRNFLSVAQELRMEIYDDKPRLLLPHFNNQNDSSSLSAANQRWKMAGSHLDTNKPDISTTLLVLADNIRGAMSSFMESARNAFSSLNDPSTAPTKIKTTAPLLVAQFRNLSNTASQFLNAVDDLPPLSAQIDNNNSRKNDNLIGTMNKGHPARQSIYNAMGLLFIASQTITNTELSIPEIKKAYQKLEECIYEIEKNVQTICNDMTNTANNNNKSGKSRSTTPVPPRSDVLVDENGTNDILDEFYAEGNIINDVNQHEFGINNHIAMTPTSNATTQVPNNNNNNDQQFNRSKTPLSDPHSPHTISTPPSSAKYPPSSSSSTYYQSGYSPSINTYNNNNNNNNSDELMEIDTYHTSSLSFHEQNESGDDLSPLQNTATNNNTAATSASTSRGPKDKLAKFFGEDTLLAAKRRDTIVHIGNSPTTPITPHTMMSTSTELSSGTASGSIAAAAAASSDKPDFLGPDYKQNEIIFNMEGNVKGGTVRALIQRLTQHDQLDSKFITSFLLTYRSFCTTEELFRELFSRYTLQPPSGLTMEGLELWQEKKLKLVRLRVFNVIKSWLDSYYIEEDDRFMLPNILEFSEKVIRESMQFGAEQLGKAIQKRMNVEDSSQLRKMTLNVRTVQIPPTILPKNLKKLRFLDIDPLELARQLTVMDSKLYIRIKPVECLDKNWGRADSQDTAANIKASIEYSNQVTAWVTDSILSKEELRKRALVLKHWIYVAEVSLYN
ncbi:hypothetical protein BJ944DRAFT_274461 [Cunninghamella echinulata]|nr:hypothetical protein BJ944DRAFT_274461 [Cunninghamella echinulata]